MSATKRNRIVPVRPANDTMDVVDVDTLPRLEDVENGLALASADDGSNAPVTIGTNDAIPDLRNAGLPEPAPEPETPPGVMMEVMGLPYEINPAIERQTRDGRRYVSRDLENIRLSDGVKLFLDRIRRGREARGDKPRNSYRGHTLEEAALAVLESAAAQAVSQHPKVKMTTSYPVLRCPHCEGVSVKTTSTRGPERYHRCDGCGNAFQSLER